MPEQLALVKVLSVQEIQMIDDALLSNACGYWRKVARVVGIAMSELQNRISEIPDLYYSRRVQYLVEQGVLESQGNLSYMRYSEVRIPVTESVQDKK